MVKYFLDFSTSLICAKAHDRSSFEKSVPSLIFSCGSSTEFKGYVSLVRCGLRVTLKSVFGDLSQANPVRIVAACLIRIKEPHRTPL